MPKTLSYEARITGGLSVEKKLVIPIFTTDPAAAEGWVWINSTTDRLKYHNGAAIIEVPLTAGGTVDTESVSDALAPALAASGTATFAYDDAANTIRVTVTDSPTVGGKTPAQLQTDITAAIVNGAASTLDTLNELAAALGNDPNFATTITGLINARARQQGFALTGGALTEVVTHNFGTTDVMAQVFVTATGQDEDFIIQRTTANTITVVSEGGNIPTGRRVVVTAKGV